MHFWKVISVLLAVLVGNGVLRAGDNVKTFPSQKCRYTLPGNDWSWLDPKIVPNTICVARNSDGLVLMLSVIPVPADTTADAKFAAGLDISG